MYRYSALYNISFFLESSQGMEELIAFGPHPIVCLCGELRPLLFLFCCRAQLCSTCVVTDVCPSCAYQCVPNAWTLPFWNQGVGVYYLYTEGRFKLQELVRCR